MTNKIKIITIILISVLLIVGVTTTSLTFAKWNAGSGGSSGTTTYGPLTDSTNWNVYERYFNYETVTGGVAITGFEGINLEDIIIPETISNQPVVEIKNIFANATQRALPVTVKIPSSVNKISASSFQNCVNLQKVYFASYKDKEATQIICECGMYLFSGCMNLSEVYVCGNRKVRFGDYDFIGCTSLTTAPQATQVNLRFKDGVDDTNYYIPANNANILYTTNAKSGASFT